ncbi:unnamed protein product, partial [marine sediment metagenome]
YYTARDNVKDWIEDRREELLEQRKVEEFSAELKAKEAQLEACQSEDGDCSEIEAEISELEDKIQEAKDKRDEAKEKAEEHLSLANEAATINWEVAQTMPVASPWDTVWVNLINVIINADVAPREKDEETEEEGWGEWGLGSHPYTIPKKSQGIITGKYNNNLINYKTFVFCTPDGLPFTLGPVGKIHGRNYSRFYTEVRYFDDGEWSEWEAGSMMVLYASQIFAESTWERPILGNNIYTYERRLGTGVNEEYDPNPDQ